MQVDTGHHVMPPPSNSFGIRRRHLLGINSNFRKMPIRIIRKVRPKLVTNCWREFCNETSLAGFNRLSLENNPWRRAFWYVIITIFTALTLYMLVRIAQGYIENPVKVTIDKVYLAEMEFPEVIICNTMNYRVSAVRPLSAMHIALSRIYESVRPDEDLARRNPQIRSVLENIADTRSYLKAIAHHAKDMIVSCTWLNSNESCENDFTSVITDAGVCYSFNHNSSDRKMVSHSGNNYGLELVLNIATYEAMNGPYNTFGARIAFVKQGYARTMRRSVNALLGEYTSIGLVAKSLLRDDSLCDRSAKLKYYNSTYTKEFCAVDYAISDVKQKCNCYPYMVDDSSYENNVSMRQCNLAQHFACAQSIIDQPPQRTDQECPTECDSYTFVPTVSTAKVAWDRVRSKVSAGYRRQVEENLLTALEISKRYRPTDNETTVGLFRELKSAVINASEFVAIVNNITNPLLQIPPNNGAPPFASNLDGFLTKVYNESLQQMNTSLALLNETLTISFDAYDNKSYVDYLLGSLNASNVSTETHLVFPIDVFTVNEGQLYLNTLSNIVEQFEKISTAKEHLRKGVLEGFYVGQQTILTAQDVQHLNGSLQSFLAILSTEQLIENRTSALQRGPIFLNYTITGSIECIPEFGQSDSNVTRLRFTTQSVYYTSTRFLEVTSEGNHTEPLLLDVLICQLKLYSSPNTEAAISHQVSRYTTAIPTNAVDPEQQREICRLVLCRAYSGVNFANCSLTAAQKLSRLHQLRNSVADAVSQSMTDFEEAKQQMDRFVDYVKTDVLVQYASAVDAATRFAKDSSQVAKDFETGLFPSMSDLSLLLSNMSAYVVSELTYKKFSATIIDYFAKLFIDPVFLFNFSTAKTRIQETLKRLDSMEAALIQLQNITSVANADSKIIADPRDIADTNANHTAAGNGVYAVAAGSLLWRNNTTQAISDSVELIRAFRNTTLPLGDAITKFSGTVKTTFDQLAGDCREFLASTVTNAEFYGRNFLVADVHMEEISEEIVQQQQALEFSNLIGDLGGAASFWFGLCMVNFVELIDYAFRYGFQCCRSASKSLFRRTHRRNAVRGTVNSNETPDLQHYSNGVCHNNSVAVGGEELANTGGGTGGHVAVAYLMNGGLVLDVSDEDAGDFVVAEEVGFPIDECVDSVSRENIAVIVNGEITPPLVLTKTPTPSELDYKPISKLAS